MAFVLIIVPLCFAIAAALLPSERLRPWLLPLGGATQVALVALAFFERQVTGLSGWLRLDAIGKIVMALCAVMFFIAALYAPAYLRLRHERPNRAFCACLMALLAAMTLVCLAHHLGLMWVALEASTLAAAPLLYFNRTARSIEATWKYLLISSVGIALALLGSFFLAYSAVHGGLETTLFFDDLVRQAPRLSRPWLDSALVLLFVGYGTKMGLAPMHAWKPDAYGEAPAVVGAVLAGALTSCAFLAVLRFYQIAIAAGDADGIRKIMVLIGLVSMGIAAIFMTRQRDFRRLLGYSSVEHMGILVLGVGLGGEALFGSLYHLINNALTKGVLFLCAGNIHRAYQSRATADVQGALRRLPFSGAMFLAAFFAITGSPPFAPFQSEFTIVRSAIAGGHYAVAAVFLACLTVVFLGMGHSVIGIVQGEPSERAAATTARDRGLLVLPAIVFLALVVLLGVYLPPPLEAALRDAARFLEGHT